MHHTSGTIRKALLFHLCQAAGTLHKLSFAAPLLFRNRYNHSLIFIEQAGKESNLQHSDLESDILPIELPAYGF